MSNRIIKDLVLENVPIAFLNFSGKAGKFNAEGNRNFSVVIEDQDTAERLIADGWNIKTSVPKNDDYDPINYIKVSVNYGQRPPKVILIANGNQTLLDENSVGSLDYAEIVRNDNNQKVADVVLHPYFWEVNGKSGIKAYLKSMYVTIEDDPFAGKYENLGKNQSPIDDEDDLPF